MDNLGSSAQSHWHILVSGSSARQWRQRRACDSKDPSGQKCPQIAAGSRSSCQWAGPIGRNACVFAWSPAMPKLRDARLLCAIDLSTTELRALDTTHSNIIKWSLGLCKLCRSTPLLLALGVQRIPAMRDHQSVNLLKRCLAGSSEASTFYWSLIHNRDTEVKRTVVNKLKLVDNSISCVVFANTRRLFYDHDGLTVLFFLLNNMNNENII